MKTIKQIADEQGTTKTSIRRRFTPTFAAEHTQTIKGVIYVSAEGEALLLERTAERRSATHQNTATERSGTALQLHTAEIRAASLAAEVEGLKKVIELMESQKAKDERTIEDLSAAVREHAESLNAANRTELAGQMQQLVLPEQTATMTRLQGLKVFFGIKDKVK